MRPLFLTLAAFSCSLSFLRALPLSNPLVEDQLNFSALAAMGSNGKSVLPGDLDTSLCCSINGINLVEVGDCNNAPDPDTGNWYGMVTKEFSIGQYDVTARQYCNYLNEVATGENYLRFYDERMGTDPNVASIKREFKNGKNQYSIIVVPKEKRDRGAFPIVYVNLYQAARFCNWLQNKSSGEFYGAEITERGAYTLDGVINGTIARNPQAVWFLPTESEWYKAAYYKGSGLRSGYWDYPNRSNWAPYNQYRKIKNNYSAANYDRGGKTEPKAPFLTEVGAFKKSVGSYNSYDMGGNVAQWTGTEEYQGGVPVTYIARGGSWKSSYYSSDSWGISELSKTVRHGYDPSQGYDHVGFRVASTHFVNSPLPATQAPGTTEWSMGDIKNAFIGAVAAGGALAAGFAGKKCYDGYMASKEETRQQELRDGEELLPQESQLTRATSRGVLNQREPGLTEGRDSAEGNELLSSNLTTPLRGRASEANSLILRERKIAELKQEIKTLSVEIPSLLHEAKDAYQTLFARNQHAKEDLEAWKEVAHKYNNYVNAVVNEANALHDTFPQNPEVWIPWYEQMHTILMTSVIRNHTIAKNFFPVGNISEEAKALRCFSNRYTENARGFILSDNDILKSIATTSLNEAWQATLTALLKQQENDIECLGEWDKASEKDSSEQSMVLNSVYLNYITALRVTRSDNFQVIENASLLMDIEDKGENSAIIDLCNRVEPFLEATSVSDFSIPNDSGGDLGSPGFNYDFGGESPSGGDYNVLRSPSTAQKKRRSSLTAMSNPLINQSSIANTLEIGRRLEECLQLKSTYQKAQQEARSGYTDSLMQAIEGAEESFRNSATVNHPDSLYSKLKAQIHFMKGMTLLEVAKALDKANQVGEIEQQVLGVINEGLLKEAEWSEEWKPLDDREELLEKYLNLARAIKEKQTEVAKRLRRELKGLVASSVIPSNVAYGRSRTSSIVNTGENP